MAINKHKMRVKLFKLISLFMCLLFATTVLSKARTNDMNLIQVAMSHADFSEFITTLQTAGLVDALQQVGPFTVFVPNNAAFAKLGDDQLQQLLDDPEKLRMVLLYHVISGQVMIDNIESGNSSEATLEGEPLEINKSEAGITLNNQAKIITADIVAQNGIIHEIDTVLIPPNISN